MKRFQDGTFVDVIYGAFFGGIAAIMFHLVLCFAGITPLHVVCDR